MTAQPLSPQLALAMTEKELQRNVVDLALTLRCRVNHQLPARTPTGRWHTATQGHKGWLDTTIVGKRGALFRELKSHRGRIDPEQYAWITAWTVAGFDAAVWKPLDWYSGRIEREIRAIA